MSTVPAVDLQRLQHQQLQAHCQWCERALRVRPSCSCCCNIMSSASHYPCCCSCCCYLHQSACELSVGDMVDSDADDDDGDAAAAGLFDEGLVPLLMGLPGDLLTSASMLYDDEVSANFQHPSCHVGCVNLLYVFVSRTCDTLCLLGCSSFCCLGMFVGMLLIRLAGGSLLCTVPCVMGVRISCQKLAKCSTSMSAVLTCACTYACSRAAGWPAMAPA